jgi:hypothetical protein
MKAAATALSLALLILSAAPARTSASRAEGPSVTGGVSLGQGGAKTFVEFNAVTRTGGGVGGRITFRDGSELPDQDVDGTGDPALAASSSGLVFTADVDGLCVTGNVAVLSGVVESSTRSGDVGRRMLFAVEDNGAGRRAADRIGWGLYHAGVQRLVADSENPEAGEFLVGGTRYVRDEENPDAGEFAVGGDLNCHSFPLDSYSFVDIGGGNLQVRP